MINDINPLRQSIKCTERWMWANAIQWLSTQLGFSVNIDGFVRYKSKRDMKIRRHCIEYASDDLNRLFALSLWLFRTASWLLFLLQSQIKAQTITGSFRFVQCFDSPFGPAQSIKHFRLNKNTHTHASTVLFISCDSARAPLFYSFLQIVLLNFKLS